MEYPQKKKKLTFFRIMKNKIKRFRRWLVGPVRRFRKRYRRSRFLWWAEIWYDVGEIAEDWWEEDSISPTDLEDLFVIQKARYFYDKYTNAYYFSHWSGQEDNYEYCAELTHLRDELEEEYGLTAQFKVPFYDYYTNITDECDQFRLAFLNEFRIESPWDLVDEDRSELLEDPSLMAVPPFVPADHPQHNQEHKFLHSYVDEDQYVMNKWDQEDGEMFVIGHHTRDEYEWDDEVPFWIDPTLDTLFFDVMRQKWVSHAASAKKENVGYNLDLVIDYSLKDYYGFLAYDDNINMSYDLALRLRYENDRRAWIPTDVYSQKQLDLIVEHLLIEGLLVPYFYSWSAPTHQEVREYMLIRDNVIWVEMRKKIFFELGDISSYVRIPYLKFKISLSKKFMHFRKILKAWYWFFSANLFVSFTRFVSFLLKNFIWLIMHILHLIWGFLWGTVALLLTIEFLHYCIDEQIITVWMKQYPGEQEIGLQWLYLGILLHSYYVFTLAGRLGNKFISHPRDIWEKKNLKERVDYGLELMKLRDGTDFDSYWKYRAANSAFSTYLYTKYDEKRFIFTGMVINLIIMFFDDQMAFHWYLEDWMHIQIAIYDWPIINGDVIITDV